MTPGATQPGGLEPLLQRIEDGQPALLADFDALCDCGGRLAGTDSERRACDLALARLAAIAALAPAPTHARAWLEPVDYAGWQAGRCTLALADGTPLACQPLLGSAATPGPGLLAGVVDLGRGTEDDFRREAARIPGRIVLVRHEYPFSPDHVHRRRKYEAARAAGAAGFVIAHVDPQASPTSGSSGRNGGEGIPAVATDHAGGMRLAAAGDAGVRLQVQGTDHAAVAATPMLDLPGRDPTDARRVVLSAHLDGHPLGESAMDNGSGLAVAIALARAVAPQMHGAARGLLVCLFTAEEWALAGSRQWLAAMAPEARNRLVIDLNLDTVGADPRLTALTSGFSGLERFVADSARAAGHPVAIHPVPMANSDHANFAAHGIPALRLVAGFGQPDSRVRHILTAQDTRDKVEPAELATAAKVAACMLWQALCATDADVASWR
jgi:aminopeptidase YwaD